MTPLNETMKYAVVTDEKIRLLYDAEHDAKTAVRMGDTLTPVPYNSREGDNIAWYYDAETEQHKTIVYRTRLSMAGRVSSPEYRVSYKLPSGGWLNGLRHTDRGDLMTDVHTSASPWVTR